MRPIIYIIMLMLLCVNVLADNDGVDGAADKCAGTPASCTSADVASNGCPAEPFTFTIENDINDLNSPGFLFIDMDPDNCLDNGLLDTQATIKIIGVGGTKDGQTIDTFACNRAGNTNYCDTNGVDCWCPYFMSTGFYENIKLEYSYSINGVSFQEQSPDLLVSPPTSQLKYFRCTHGTQTHGEPAPPRLVLTGEYEVVNGKFVVQEGVAISMDSIGYESPICSNAGPDPGTGPGPGPGGPNPQNPPAPLTDVVSGQPIISNTFGMNLLISVKNENTGQFVYSDMTGESVHQGMTYDEVMANDKGILITTSNINSWSGAKNLFKAPGNLPNFLTMDEFGEYTVYVNYLNEVCDSPVYSVCPNTGANVQSTQSACRDPGLMPYVRYQFTINDKPEFGVVPNQEIMQDFDPYWTVDLCEYVDDQDATCGIGADPKLEFTLVSETNTALIDCDVISHYFYCSTPAPGMIGSSLLEFDVYDQIQHSTTYINVNIHEKSPQGDEIILKWGQEPEKDLLKVE